MRTTYVIYFGILVGLIAHSAGNSQTALDEPFPELVHSITEYNIDYQTRAQGVAEVAMSYYGSDGVVRWNPVRINPQEVLKYSHLKQGSMPRSLRITPFPDVTIFAKQTSYSVQETVNGAIWHGTIVGSDSSSVRISIVNSDQGPGFLVNIWNPPRKFQIITTDYADIYVAMEIRVNPAATLD